MTRSGVVAGASSLLSPPHWVLTQMAKSTAAILKFISKLGLLLAALDTPKANKLIEDIELLIGDLTND